MSDNISNEYSMVSILQNIGQNFFPADLATQRIGMFGFTTEALANIFGANIFDSNMRANEYHTITAKKEESLLYEAEVLGIDVETAVPSILPAYLALDVKQLINNDYIDETKDEDYKTYYFIIEKDTKINISGYIFMLEYDVLITASYSDGSYSYSTKYLTEGDIDPHNNSKCKNYVYVKDPMLTTLNSKYIPNTKITYNGSTLLMVQVNLRQMTKNYEYYTVIDNDIITLTGLEYTFKDNLAFFNVFYRENNNSNWEYVKPISMYDDSDYGFKTIQYSIDNDVKTITFNATQFTPKYNSEFRFDIYTTKGSLGNIKYSGNGSDIKIKLNSYNERHSYAGFNLLCTPISQAYGGQDTPTIEKLRSKIITAKASKNSLTTEYDLYNYMRKYDLVNDYYFVKKRSDIVEHIYSTFMLPRDANGAIIPTSTVDIIMNISNNQYNIPGILYGDNTISILAGTPFVIDDYNDPKNKAFGDWISSEEGFKIHLGGDKYSDGKRFVANVLDRTKEDGSIMTIDEVTELESERAVFALPYTIIYDKVNQVESIYMASINNSFKMSWDSGQENSICNFAVDHINVYRDTLKGDSFYHITVSVIANGDYKLAVNDMGVYTPSDKYKLLVKGFLYRSEESMLDTYNDKYSNKVPYAFFNLECTSFSDGVFVFETDINVTDVMDLGNINKIKSPNSLYNIIDVGSDDIGEGDDYFDNLNPSENTAIDVSNLLIGIGTYYISDEVDTSKDDKPKVVIQNDKTLAASNYYPEFTYQDVPYILTDVYINTSDKINLYTDMSYIIRSNVNTATYTYLNDSSSFSNEDYIHFKDMPVIQYSKAVDKTISEAMTEYITLVREVLMTINSKLDNSFTIDYKFFRTYGPCQYFKLQTSDAKKTIELNRLDLKISFNVRVKTGITITDDDIINKLRVDLKKIIERINTEDDDYTIYISNIITELENNYPDLVKSIDLVDVNDQGDTYRVLYYDKPSVDRYINTTVSNRNEVKYFVPEYINLPLSNIKINIIR